MGVKHVRSWQQHTNQEPITKDKEVIVKVRKTGWITKGEKILYTLFSACVIAGALYIVSYSSSTDTLNRELQSLEQTILNQEVTNEGLLFEVRELSKPDRITKIAKEKGLKIQDSAVKRAQLFNN